MATEFKKTGIVQSTVLEDTRTATIYKSDMIIKPNLILDSAVVTSGGNAAGITSEYLSDGSLKIVSASGNGNWRSIGFARSSDSNVGANMTVGDTYTISVEAKMEVGTAFPTLFINSGNGYKQLIGDTSAKGIWQRIYYTSTWAAPGSSYGNISLHLGFSGAIGTYYFRNFKLEKSAVPTIWIPNSTDAIYSKLNFGGLSTTLSNVVKTTEIIEN